MIDINNIDERFSALTDKEKNEFIDNLFFNMCSAVDEIKLEKTEEISEDLENLKELHQKLNNTKQTRNRTKLPIYQNVISDKDYQYALTVKQNKNAYLALVNPDFFHDVQFQNGDVTYNNYVISTIKEYKKGEYKDISEINFPLLVQFYTIAYKHAKERGERTITVHLPTFFKSVGTNIKSGNPADVMKQIYSFRNLVGIMPKEKTISSVFQIIEIDMLNETITFATPYMNKLFRLLDEKNTKEKKIKGDSNIFTLPYHNKLIRSKITSERNKAAAELVYLITTGLLQRGKTPDALTYKNKHSICSDNKLVTYSISFKSLVEQAPILKGRINNYKTTSDKNKALKRAFEGAYKLLNSRTDAHKYYIDLFCNNVIPTMSTLDANLIITHHGINGDYKPIK